MPVLACSRVQIEDADAGRLAARARGGRNGDQRLERPGDRQALADRRVDVVEKIGRRIRRVEIGRLGGVDRAAAADGDERVARLLALANAIASRKDSSVGSTRTRSNSVNAIPLASSDSRTVCTGGRRDTIGIGDDERLRDAEVREVRADLPRDARAEPHGRRRHLERVVIGHVRCREFWHNRIGRV